MEKVLPLREAVQVLLNKRGESKYGLAKKMGVHPQGFDTTLKRDVRLSTFFKLAEALDMTASELAAEIDKLRS